MVQEPHLPCFAMALPSPGESHCAKGMTRTVSLNPDDFPEGR